MPVGPLLFIIAPLFACTATIAAAQGERPWMDPPAPGSQPAPEPLKPARASDAAAAPRQEILQPEATGKRKAPPLIDFGAPAPAASRQADRPRPETAQSADRNTKPAVRTERHATQVRSHPSFNCRGARTSVERAICANQELAAKDRRMATLYEQAGGSRRGPVDRVQWRWLAARNACARTRALQECIDDVYDARIAELSSSRR
jgi:uncharacterized protein YecT (DUF1311 family)